MINLLNYHQIVDKFFDQYQLNEMCIQPLFGQILRQSRKNNMSNVIQSLHREISNKFFPLCRKANSDYFLGQINTYIYY